MYFSSLPRAPYSNKEQHIQTDGYYQWSLREKSSVRSICTKKPRSGVVAPIASCSRSNKDVFVSKFQIFMRVYDSLSDCPMFVVVRSTCSFTVCFLSRTPLTWTPPVWRRCCFPLRGRYWRIVRCGSSFQTTHKSKPKKKKKKEGHAPLFVCVCVCVCGKKGKPWMSDLKLVLLNLCITVVLGRVPVINFSENLYCFSVVSRKCINVLCTNYLKVSFFFAYIANIHFSFLPGLWIRRSTSMMKSSGYMRWPQYQRTMICWLSWMQSVHWPAYSLMITQVGTLQHPGMSLSLFTLLDVSVEC